MIPDWLHAAVERCEQEQDTLGRSLAEHRARHGLTPAGQCDLLGCTEETRLWLSLCRRPSPSAAEVALITARFEVNGEALLSLLREASG